MSWRSDSAGIVLLLSRPASEEEREPREDREDERRSDERRREQREPRR